MRKYESKQSSQWSPKSEFVRADKCDRCDDGITASVSPTHWPIGSVALVCYACGRVREYVDDLLLMTPREAVLNYQPRAYAVRKRIGIQPSNAEVARELVLLGLESGLSPAMVADQLHVQRSYVINIARAAEIPLG